MTKQEQQIQSELAACREAWAEFFKQNKLKPTSTHFKNDSPIQAWCLHHEQLAEELTEPIENRISYILSDKPKSEWACRFLNLRPMSLDSIKVYNPARAEYNKVYNAARAEYDKVRNAAWAECDKVCDAARAEYNKVRNAAWAEYDKVCDAARAEYNKVRNAAWAECYDKVRDAARAEYDKVCCAARAEYDKVCCAAHLVDVPNHRSEER